jgi:hypothetical protein
MPDGSLADRKRLRKLVTRLLKAEELARRPLPVFRTAEERADDTWHCGGKCGKTLGQLEFEGNIIVTDGYEQCANCHADIDCASRTPREPNNKRKD